MCKNIAGSTVNRLYSSDTPAPVRTEKSKFEKRTIYLAYDIDFVHFLIAINNITLLGRVGADPLLRGNAEHPVVTFSLATHTNYKYVFRMFRKTV